MSLLRHIALGVTGAALSQGALAVVGARSRDSRWARINHRGEPVSLLAGPALAIGATGTSVCGARPGLKLATLVAGAGSGLVGVYDDIVGARPEQRADKGVAGHWGALRAGRVSAGAVKVAGVGLSAYLAAGSVTRGPADRVLVTGVIAGTANLLNLLDLRPGRAIKAGLLLGLPLLPGRHGGQLAGPMGAAAGLLPADLGERVMLGDGGANALGALLGLRIALAGGPRWRCGVLTALVGLTAASEGISFTTVIESTPVLREVDAWGRRPAGSGR